MVSGNGRWKQVRQTAERCNSVSQVCRRFRRPQAANGASTGLPTAFGFGRFGSGKICRRCRQRIFPRPKPMPPSPADPSSRRLRLDSINAYFRYAGAGGKLAAMFTNICFTTRYRISNIDSRLHGNGGNRENPSHRCVINAVPEKIFPNVRQGRLKTQLASEHRNPSYRTVFSDGLRVRPSGNTVQSEILPFFYRRNITAGK